MRNLEKQMAQEPQKASRLIGKWVQSINSLSGLARRLGLEKRAKQTNTDLKTYIKNRKKA